ncbi:MAG: amidophosphoribosyltransferase, partial [Oscillospiraceae bacterium]
MGGFFGAASKRDCVVDVFYGTDFHSHLGTRRGGMAAFSPQLGMQRYIHNIESTPFRAKFEKEVAEMQGNTCIGSISDTDPQPILIRSRLGIYAISTIGIVSNLYELADMLIAESNCHFESMSGGIISTTELIASLINKCSSFAEGIRYAQSVIVGTASILIMTDKGEIIAARDKVGRLPVILGRDEDGYCVSFESFAYQKLGYEDFRELGPGEIVRITAEGVETLAEPNKNLKICAFLWSYYGYPNATYEGVNVEVMRARNGHIMAKNEAARGALPPVDYVCGVPDSGIPHAIGYSNE